MRRIKFKVPAEGLNFIDELVEDYGLYKKGRRGRKKTELLNSLGCDDVAQSGIDHIFNEGVEKGKEIGYQEGFSDGYYVGNKNGFKYAVSTFKDEEFNRGWAECEAYHRFVNNTVY